MQKFETQEFSHGLDLRVVLRQYFLKNTICNFKLGQTPLRSLHTLYNRQNRSVLWYFVAGHKSHYTDFKFFYVQWTWKGQLYKSSIRLTKASLKFFMIFVQRIRWIGGDICINKDTHLINTAVLKPRTSSSFLSHCRTIALQLDMAKMCSQCLWIE